MSMLTMNDEKVNTTSIEVTNILPVSEAIADDLAYWIKRGTYGNVFEDKHWIRNTQEALAKHLGYSVSSIKRGLKELRDMGIIQARSFSRNKRNRELSYTIDIEKWTEIKKALKRQRKLGYIPQRSEKSKPYKQTVAKSDDKNRQKPLNKPAIELTNEPSNELSNEPMYIYQKKIHKSWKKRITI